MNPVNVPEYTATKLDRQLAKPMFVVAVMFLVIAGFLLPTLLYREPLPPLRNLTPKLSTQNAELFQSDVQAELPEEIVYFVPEVRSALKIVLAALYALLILEALAHWMAAGKCMRQHILYLLIPFMRLSTRDHVDGSSVWVVGIGWTKSTLLLEKQLANAFGIPMMAIALPVLPLVVIQLFWSSTVNSNPHLKFMMATATAIIWAAFVFEFAIMFSVTKRKLKYCKEHWINLLIVLLPAFGFLRLAALGSLFKLNQLAKTVSVLRLRGLAIRFWRAMISLGVIDKALRKTHDHKIEKLDQLIAEKQEELELLHWEKERAVELKKQKAMQTGQSEDSKKLEIEAEKSDGTAEETQKPKS
jgi:voltage-gated potassium channel